MSNSQQKRVMFALYQEPFIVPQEAGADWQVLKSFLFFDLLYVPSFLLEVTFLKLSDSFCLCPSLCLSVCLCLPFSPTHMPTASPSSLSLLCCLLLLFSSYKHSWGNFSILVALATHNCQKLLSWCWVGSCYLAHLASSSWLPSVICPRYGADISQMSWLTYVIQSLSPGKSFFLELSLLLCSFLFSISSQIVTLKGRQNFTHIKNTILFPDPQT